MALLKVSSPAGLLVLALMLVSTKVSAVAPVRHRHGHLHRQPVGNVPPEKYTPSTIFAYPAPTDLTPSPTALENIGSPVQPLRLPTGSSPRPRPQIPRPPPVANKRGGEGEVVVSASEQIATPVQPQELPTGSSPRPRPQIPHPPPVANKHDGEGEAVVTAFEPMGAPIQPLALSMTQHPHLVANQLPQEYKVGLFERFASPSAPLAGSDGTRGISPQPYPLYGRGVSHGVLWFFLVAAGFFFQSLVWNLYIQFPTAQEKANAKSIDATAVAAMRMDNLSQDSQHDKKAHPGAGSWLRAANSPFVSPSPV